MLPFRHGELFFHIFGALAQYERALTRERVQAGLSAAVEKRLESLKWYLWHGNVFRAMDEIEDLQILLDGGQALPESGGKLLKALNEFHAYIQANEPFIPTR